MANTKSKTLTPMYGSASDMIVLFGMSRQTIDKTATAAGAKVKVGRRVIYDIEKFNNYLKANNEAR